MDSNLNSQLDQHQLGQSARSSEFTSPLPPLAPSSPPSSFSPSVPPTSILSLPSEVISEVFKSISESPSSKRNSTLTSLCLVNRLFLDLARPFLYQEVSLDLVMEYENPGSRTRELFSALVDNPGRANLVRGIRLSVANALDSDLVILARLLSHLKHLESIRISWNHSSLVDGGEGLVKMISKHQPRLRSLTLPDVGLDYAALNAILSNLNELENYKGILPSPPQSESDPPFPNLSCKFRKLVLLRPRSDCFKQVTRLSHASLTSLEFSLPGGDAGFDLANFPNLFNLRLELEASYSYAPPDPNLTRLLQFASDDEDAVQIRRDYYAEGVRRILLSARNVKNLTLSTRNGRNGRVIFDWFFEKLFDVLPPALVQFSSVPLFLEADHVNRRLLYKAIRSRSLPHLRRIIVIPRCTREAGRRRQIVVIGDLERVCASFGIAIERSGPVGAYVHTRRRSYSSEEDS